MDDSTTSDGSGIKISRRSLLRTSGLGLAGVAFTGFAESQLDETKIVTAEAAGKPIETRNVPTGWLEHENRVEKAQRTAINQYSSTPGVFRIAQVNSDEKIRNHYKSKIEVSVEPNSRASVIPDQIGGIPTEIVIERNTITADSCEEDLCKGEEYHPVPGGVPINNPDGGSFTSTSKAWGPANNPGIVTCAHGFKQGRTCDRDLTGEVLEQNGAQMGEVPGTDYFLHDEDWAFLDESGNQTNGYEGEIDGVGPVVGYKTKSGLNNMKSRDETVHKMGLRTCETSEQITGVGVWYSPGGDLCISTSNAVELEGCAKKGDSGCPHYNRYYDPSQYRVEAQMICPHFGGTDTHNYGTAAYHMWKTHGISWTPR